MAAERIEPPARPSFGGVLAQVWAIVRARWPVLLLAAAVIFIPAGLLEAVDHELQQPLAEAEELSSLEVVEIVVAVFVIAATALLGDVLYAGVVAALLTAEREGRELRLRERLAGLPVARLVAADLALALVVVDRFASPDPARVRLPDLVRARRAGRQGRAPSAASRVPAQP